MKDSIYANPLGDISAFTFDEDVVSVFPDMIQRSVPGYSTIITAIGLLAKRYAQPNSHCYDLGCSLGAAALSMREQIAAQNCRIIAVDNSSAMVSGFEDRLRQLPSSIPVDVFCTDITDINIENASVVVLNFTLQFIPIADRIVLLQRINHGLLPGGILILSEKLKFDDDKQNALQTDMHHQFKKAQGYSDLEICQKRTALENVLIPETFGLHQQRLLDAGFSSAEVWFQYFNFASIIALK
ncbi:carboxy-S-adenosyl-L-methionine synthase CmoA [Methyloglobulus sp.]|uniref:carboxy-S-adenosyl-L-methionine synthase CmoA n=1 Tax=Methyloglobulus sp. TaxID=2518622 RepID=UPI0032B7A9D4